MACARHWARPDTVFSLVGRSAKKLSQVADDLAARGAKVHSHVLDLNRFDLHAHMLDACYSEIGHVDIAS